jgi:hypothetical protein
MPNISGILHKAGYSWLQLSYSSTAGITSDLQCKHCKHCDFYKHVKPYKEYSPLSIIARSIIINWELLTLACRRKQQQQQQ